MKKKNISIVFDDIITDMEVNKKLSPLLTELLLRGRVCITVFCQSAKSYKIKCNIFFLSWKYPTRGNFNK